MTPGHKKSWLLRLAPGALAVLAAACATTRPDTKGFVALQSDRYT